MSRNDAASRQPETHRDAPERSAAPRPYKSAVTQSELRGFKTTQIDVRGQPRRSKRSRIDDKRDNSTTCSIANTCATELEGTRFPPTSLGQHTLATSSEPFTPFVRSLRSNTAFAASSVILPPTRTHTCDVSQRNHMAHHPKQNLVRLSVTVRDRRVAQAATCAARLANQATIVQWTRSGKQRCLRYLSNETRH